MFLCAAFIIRVRVAQLRLIIFFIEEKRAGKVDKINLCMLAPEFLPVWGGTGSYTIELIKSLPKNVDVHVVTLKRDLPGMSHSTFGENELRSIFKRDIQVHPVSSSKETFFYNLPFQMACYKEIPRLHKEFNFDIIHSHLCHMPDVFLQILHGIHVPTVLTVHGTIQSLRAHALLARSMFGDLESSEDSILRFYPIIRFLQQKYVKRVSRLIAVSDMTRKLALEDLNVRKEKVTLVYNGVDTELFRWPPDEQLEKKYSEPTVVYVGRLIAKKGINILIDAMPEVLKKFKDTQFLFIGSGNISAYKKIIRSKGIPDKNFSFLGHLGYFERQKILQKTTVFVNPSFFENCSISILEAMSCGCSVVACNVGGNPELIESGQNGLLVPAFDRKKLSASILSLLENETFNKSISRNARKTVEEKFSSIKSAKETCAVYDQTLSNQ